MLKRKPKTTRMQWLTESDSDEDVEINVKLSPQLKRTCLPQKHWSRSRDWEKCADSFSGLNPLPERGKRRKRHSISELLRQQVSEKKSVEEEFGNDEIVWNSSDEDIPPPSQSVAKHKAHPLQKVKLQILAKSNQKSWPSEVCDSLSKRNDRKKSEKIPFNNLKSRLRHYREPGLSRNPPELYSDDEVELGVQEFDDSDDNSSAKHENPTIIETFSSDEESLVIGASPSNSIADENEQSSDQCLKSDVDISTLSSSNFSAECAGGTGAGRKTSEWLQALQNVTPTKNQDSSASSSQQEASKLYDSAKKKRRPKFNKDGLAGKLSRIISREKTAMNVWSFRQSDLPNEQKNILTACVHSFCCKVGLVTTLCSFGTLSSENVWTIKDKQSFQTILFRRTSLEFNKLTTGSVIRIFPPWQELLIPETGEKVLLCTYYCQLLEPVPNILDMMNNRHMDASKIVCQSYQWNCLCSLSDGLIFKYCPASTCPVMTKCPKIQLMVTDKESVISRNTSKTESSLNIVGLMTEDAIAGGDNTILDSIQAASTSFQHGLSFRAMVLRIFCADNSSKQTSRKKKKQSLKSWSVLVEDSQGTICIVHLSEEKHGSKNSLIKLIESTEGETWNFFGLRVYSRSNRHRDPALFSMIDKVWIYPSEQNELPKSSNGSDHEIAAQVKPGFCYVTGPSGDVGVESGVIPHRNNSTHSEPTTQPNLSLHISTLKEIKLLQDNNATRMRFTFIAKIFYVRSKSKERVQHENQSVANAKMILFLSDPSISEESYGCNYITVHCLPLCYLNEELTTNTKSAPHSTLVLMRDVLIEQDAVAFADGYTRIWHWPPPLNIRSQIAPSVSEDFVQQCRDLSFSLQSLQENSQINSLFKVQGVIYSVDHKTAVTWETCPHCDEERLAVRQDAKEERHLVCLDCDVQLEESVTHINLEVIIRCLSLPGHCEVRVSLLQSTIESLLPTGNHEEGYDVAAILGQQVGPLPCLLKKQSTPKQHPVFYLEEIRPT